MNRKELIEAARKRSWPKLEHLSICPECREAVQLLKAFPVLGKLPLPDAPGTWVNRAIAIVENSTMLDKIKHLSAKLIFDSWAAPQPVGVRGEGTLSDRRIRFESKGIIFDLRAEHRRKDWAFTGHASGRGDITSGMLLGIDKKILQADTNGIFEWSSSRPPKKISLNSEDFVIQMPELTWKKPRSK